MARHGTGRSDANQAEIVTHLRTYPGVYVKVISCFPGVMDLLVYCNGVLTWWEIKRPGHRKDLTKAEREILDACPGVSYIVTTIEEADHILETWHNVFLP